jgi:hypothetical protein
MLAGMPMEVNVIKLSALKHPRRSFIALTVGSLLVASAGVVGPAGAAVTVVSGAGGKATSPPTDLVHYPKLTQAGLDELVAQDRATQAAQPGSGEVAKDVVSVETSPDGTMAVTQYTPAPGVTPEALADMLRQQGIQGVEVLAPEPAGPEVEHYDDCALGQARTIHCLPYYWLNNGYANPIVRFVDHSGVNWPVDNAVYQWNAVPEIDSWYYWSQCPYMAGARCVHVRSGMYGNTGWIGLAHYEIDFWTHHFTENASYIKLNDYYTPPSRLNIALHEIGHILGLGHNLWSGDCMYQHANSRNDIGGENYYLLNSVYSITRYV